MSVVDQEPATVETEWRRPLPQAATMWDRPAASMPAVTSKQLESAMTSAGLVQLGAGAVVAAAVGVGAASAVGVAVGAAVGFTLGEAVARAVVESVAAGGLAVHAAMTSDVATNVSRTSGPVLIP